MLQADLFEARSASVSTKWPCLPVPGFMRAAKVPPIVLPPEKHGPRRVICVDSFAGGGGASTGIEEALELLQAMGLLPVGHRAVVDFAVNHDEPALAMHKANHRDTIHLPHNVWKVRMKELLGDNFYYSNSAGDGSQASSIRHPMPAATTKDRFGLVEADAAPPPLTEAQLRRARQVADFLRQHGCWDGGDLVTVTIRGIVYVIVDIGMRMLTPRELARAQSFPDWYILNPIFNGKPLSETEQRHKIGNSVTRLTAKAHIVANYRPPVEWAYQGEFLEAAE